MTPVRFLSLVILGCITICGVVPVVGLTDEGIPTTQDEITTAARTILRNEILSYLSVKYGTGTPSHLTSNQLNEAIQHYPEYPRRITDSKGTTIVITKPLKRIVAYNFHAMGALNAEDLVVGVANSAFQDSCMVPQLMNKVNIGGGGPYEPDFEKVISCKPDALLTYTELGPGPDFFEKRMPEGVPVIRLDFIRPWSLVTEMHKLGYILNRTEESNAYAAWHDRWMREIDQRVATIPEEKRVRVFIDIWSTSFTDRSNERRTAGQGQWYSYGQYCIDGGGINVARDISNPQSTVDIEWLAQQNPDIILGVMYDGSYESADNSVLKAQYDELVSHPTLKDIKAIKEKRIYVLSYRYTNGLTYPAARARVAKWFYPELFSDINPAAIHQEYVTGFLGSSYDVTRQGAFSYPD